MPMAKAMNPEPEYTRHERFSSYAEALLERFTEGCLAELQDLPQWVVWRAELEDGKHKKVPYNPNYYQIHARVSVKIPKSWGTLDQALTALESGHYTGLGFMITPPLVMIDLVHSYDRSTHTITDPKAAEIVQSLHSNTEASPGNGLHVLAYGSRPGKNIHTAIEMYGQDRFITITTDHIPRTPTTIEQRQEAIDALYNRFAPPVMETSNQNTSGGLGSAQPLRNSLRKRYTMQSCNGSSQVTSQAIRASQTLILCSCSSCSTGQGTMWNSPAGCLWSQGYTVQRRRNARPERPLTLT